MRPNLYDPLPAFEPAPCERTLNHEADKKAIADYEVLKVRVFERRDHTPAHMKLAHIRMRAPWVEFVE